MMTDEQIIERCRQAGIAWIAPDDDPDGFPGSFDMVSMAEMRSLLTGSAPALAPSREAATPAPYAGPRCMCLGTGCRAGPGCPHFTEHCRKHIDHTFGLSRSTLPAHQKEQKGGV